MRAVRLATPPGAPRLPRLLAFMLPLLIFAAFMTDTSFIPGIETHFGAFEIACALTFVMIWVQMARYRLAYARHPLVDIVVMITVLATLSQINIPTERWSSSLIDLSILLLFTLFLALLYQVVRHYRISPLVILRWTTYSILVIGPWIFLEGSSTGGSIQAVGPFRNRAHMGFYMLTAFWVALMFRQWPGLRKRDRWAAHGAMALALYAVAVSGRRSVYLALFVGLVGLGVSSFVARRGSRATILASAVFLVVFLGLFYIYGELFLPRAAFFKERIGLVGNALAGAVATTDNVDPDEGFVALQRQGALQAFRQNPLVGIGWGGFYRSIYSPTGHEVHSTPLRFLAELGLIGLGLYVALMFYLLSRTVRLFSMLRHSPYAGTYQVQALAFWSLSVSYLYNRHLSERTFWLLLVLFLALERFAHRYVQVSEILRGGSPSPAPGRPGNVARRPVAVVPPGPLPAARRRLGAGESDP